MLALLRRYKFHFLILLTSYLFLECCSYLLYGHITGHSFSFSSLQKQRISAIEHHGNKQTPEDSSPHPFVGYVWNYSKINTIDSTPQMVKPYGYRAEEDPFVTTKDTSAAIVAITGGSVSEFLFMDAPARAIMRSYIQKIPAFKDKRIVFITLGRNSYQQPQQVFSVAYYLLQGGRIDILINLDGHNEASYGFENQSNHRHPTFPLYWNQYTANFSDIGLRDLANAAMWRHLRREAAELSLHASFSVTASTLWSLIDVYCLKNAIQAENSSTSNSSKNPNAQPYFSTGSNYMNKASRKELGQYELDFWERSSIQLYGLSKANNFQYFHFLQPHQYVDGSKILSAEERKLFYTLDVYTNRDVREFYPLFQAGIVELHTKGVQAYSLVDVYKNTAETVYSDSCCHLNPLGNKILANAIGKRITDTMHAK